MFDLDSVARAAVEVSLHPRPGEKILIHGWDHTVDLMSELAWQCRSRGCHVMISVQPENFWLRSIVEAPMNQLETPPENLMAALEESQAFVFTLGPRHPIPWKEIPEERREEVSIWLDTRYDRSKFAETWAKVARKQSVRMLAIEATLATPERAAVMGLSFQEWRDVMFEGCLADWNEISQRARKVAKLLSGSDKVQITTPDGTDLEFRLDERAVEYADGLTSDEKASKGIVTFLPAGIVEVSIDEESAEGEVVYDLPIGAGSEVVRKLTLRIKRGRVVDNAAVEGKNAFQEYLRKEGDVNRLSFFGIGLNPNMRFGFTQDDKVLGGITIGLGDNETKGGRNHAKGQEWWGGVSRATVTIGGTQIMQLGRLVI